MYQTPKFAGAVRYNAPKGCATRLCRACVELTVCVAVRYPITANISRNKRNGNPTAVPYFRSGRRSLVCARLSNKGKAGVQRGRKTAGCPSFLPTAVGTTSSPPRMRQSPALRRAQFPAEVQRKTLRPLGTNTLTQFVHPGFPVQKRSRPLGANTLTQFAYPSHPVPRMPDRSAVLGKSKNPIPNGTGFCTSLYMCSGISPER